MELHIDTNLISIMSQSNVKIRYFKDMLFNLLFAVLFCY